MTTPRYKNMTSEQKWRIRASKRRWKEANPEKVKELAKRYRENNREKIRKRGKLYYEKNRDRELARIANWYEENRELANMRARESRARRLETNPEDFRAKSRAVLRKHRITKQKAKAMVALASGAIKERNPIKEVKRWKARVYYAQNRDYLLQKARDRQRRLREE